MAKGPKGSKMLILALIKTIYILLLIRLVREWLKKEGEDDDDLGKEEEESKWKECGLAEEEEDVAVLADEGEVELKGVSSSKSASILSPADTEPIWSVNKKMKYV